jgi:hypothetical protein
MNVSQKLEGRSRRHEFNRLMFITYLFCDLLTGPNSVYAVSIGGISSSTRSLAIPAENREEMRKVAETKVPLGRLTTAIEPVRATYWLLSVDASFMIGSHLVCDGGVLAKRSVSFRLILSNRLSTIRAEKSINRLGEIVNEDH